MYCTKCGAKNDDRGRFCIKCGASLEMNNDAHSSQERKESRRLSIGKIKLNTRAVIVLTAIIIAVVLFVIWILPDSPSTGTSSQTKDSELTTKELSTEGLPTEEPSTEEYIEIPEGERTVFVSSKGFDRNTTEPVVLYYDGFKVIFLGIDYQDAQEPKIVIQIENQTNESVQLSQECVVINGYTLDGTFSCIVEPKEVQIERITLNASELEMCEIDEIVELKLFLNVKSEGGDSASLIGPVLIKNPDSQYVQEYDDSGIEIYRKNGIRVVAKISLTWENKNDWFEKIWTGEDFEVEVYIENNSENNCSISTVGDVMVTEASARQDDYVLQEDDQGIQFTHKVMAGSKRVGTFCISHETLKEYGRNGVFVPESLKSMLEIWDIDTQSVLEKTGYIEFLYLGVLEWLEWLEALEVGSVDEEGLINAIMDMYLPNSTEKIQVEGYAYVEVCGNYWTEVLVFTDNSRILLMDIYDESYRGYIQGDEVYDFAGREDFYCVYSASDSVKQLLHSFRGDEETEYTQEVVLEANLDNNEYYHITDKRMKVSKEEFDRLWNEYLKDGEKIEMAPFGDVSLIEKWKAKYGVSDEASYEESETMVDKSRQVMEMAIAALYNQDVAGYYSLLPKEYQEYVNNPTVVFNSTYQSTGVEGSPIAKGEKLVLEYVREESADVAWVNQIASSMGFTATEQKEITYKVSSESEPEVSQNIVLTLVKVKDEWYVWFWF